MIVIFKLNIRQKMATVIGLILWIVYFLNAYSLYSQVSSFITPGSSYIIKILEFTNYRASELSTSLIFYFILISITSCFMIYDYKHMSLVNKKNFLFFIVVIYLILLLIILFITNIFFPVYLILTLLAIIIVVASFIISSVLWGSTTTFEKNDIIFKSEAYNEEHDAQRVLEKIMSQLRQKHINKIQGELFEDNHKFYFEIYALDKITLDSKGDFQFYEDI